MSKTHNAGRPLSDLWSRAKHSRALDAICAVLRYALPSLAPKPAASSTSSDGSLTGSPNRLPAAPRRARSAQQHQSPLAGASSHRLAAKDSALSRRQHGFESRWECCGVV
jgi:hypothetical protein